MKRRPSTQPAESALEMIEEATLLLRLAPPATFACYFAGTLPFILGLLYFWSDMSRGAFAYAHAAGESLGLALLFLWMKTCHAAFASRLRSQLCGEVKPRWPLRRWLRVALTQTVFQSIGLFLVPAALAITIAFGWVFAFFQNATGLGDAPDSTLKDLFRRVWQQTRLRQGQNHTTLALLLLFGLFVFLNLGVACFAAPFLPKILLGIESAATLRAWSLLNTTFLTTVLALTWLCLDPLIKAVYVLRCFYGESLQSGDDLKAGLRRSKAPVAVAIGVVIAFLALAVGQPAPTLAATPEPAPASSTSVSPADLDRSIHDVLNQREYSWRSPREKPVVVEEQNKTWLDRFFGRINDTLASWRDAIGRSFRKLFGDGRTRSGGGSGAGGALLADSMRVLLIALVVVLAGIIIALLVRMWRRRAPSQAIVEAKVIAVPVPDLTDENVGAHQLPEDSWIRLARELLVRGEWRLALRAFYFASLQHLAQRNLLTLARFKSNHDYLRELDRRAHAVPDLLATFAHNVAVFDRVWYGNHPADTELLHQFAANVDRIKTA